MSVKYKLLDETLNKTRDTLVAICDSLGIDSSEVNPSLLEVESCTNCGIWGRNHAHVDDLPVCQFCNDIDSLRF